MDRSNRTVLLGVILSTLIFSDILRPTLGISCSYRSKNTDHCVILNVCIYKTSDAEKFNFPTEKVILLNAPTILYKWDTLIVHFPTAVDELLMYDGNVPEVYIMSSLITFKAKRSHVLNVVIEETGKYLLEYLSLAYNQLSSIPENISMLTNLEKLYLHDNNIETVNMDHFKALTSLQLLALQGNRITRINTKTALNLPSLTLFVLRSNYLENLSIKLWIFPNLNDIDMKNNRLQMIENFPEQFPNLNETALYHNRWSCSWLERANLWTGKIKVFKGNELCPGKRVKGICCYDSLDDVKNQLEKSMGSQLDQISAKLDRVIEIMDGKISQLDNKLSNDMVHAVQSIREEVKSVESTARRQMLGEFQKVNARVNSNQALTENDRKQLEEKVGELKSVLNRSGEQCSNSHYQLKEELKLVNKKLNENRALIDDVVEDLYLEELEKQKL